MNKHVNKTERQYHIEAIDAGYRGMFNAMASPCEILIETDQKQLATHISDIVANEVWRIEEKFSRYRDDNIIYQINNAKGAAVEVDEELAYLIDFAQMCYQISEGLFDITSGVLRRAWRFDCSDNIPTQAQIEPLMQLVGWEKATWQKPSLILAEGMEIDLGGIGKEYAVDRAAALVAAETDEPVLLNFGGDLFATKKPKSRDKWQVGIESIGGSTKYGVIQIEAGAVATSGDAQRYLESNGKRYSHVLNPQTGWSVENAPKSVTVAAPRCIEAGFLSTLAMLKGEEAEAFLEAQEVTFWIQR